MIMIMLRMYLHIMISSGATKIKAVTQMYGNMAFFYMKCVVNFRACISSKVASNSVQQHMYSPL